MSENQGGPSWQKKLSSRVYRTRFIAWMKEHFAEAMIDQRTGWAVTNYLVLTFIVNDVIMIGVGLIIGNFGFVAMRCMFIGLFTWELKTFSSVFEELGRADNAATWAMLRDDVMR